MRNIMRVRLLAAVFMIVLVLDTPETIDQTKCKTTLECAQAAVEAAARAEMTVESFRTQLQSLEDRTTEYADQLAKWSGNQTDSVKGMCPDGQYVVGIRLRPQGGGECKAC